MYAKKRKFAFNWLLYFRKKVRSAMRTSPVAITQNKTKWDAVRSAWRVIGTQRKGRRFFFFFFTRHARTRTWNLALLGNAVGVPSVWRSVCDPRASQSGLGWASSLVNHLDRKFPLHSAFEASLPCFCALGVRNWHFNCRCCANKKLFLACITEEGASSFHWPGLRVWREQTLDLSQERRCPEGWVLDIPQNSIIPI